MASRGLAEPPTAAIVGENVPRENDTEAREQLITQTYRTIRAKYGGRLDEAALRRKTEQIVDESA